MSDKRPFVVFVPPVQYHAPFGRGGLLGGLLVNGIDRAARMRRAG